MEADTNIIRDLADLKAGVQGHDIRLNAVETGLGILHKDFMDARIDSAKQASALEAIQGHTKQMAESIAKIEQVDRSAGRFYKIISGLIAAAAMIVASVVATKSDMDPAVLREIVKDAIVQPTPASSGD